MKNNSKALKALKRTLQQFFHLLVLGNPNRETITSLVEAINKIEKGKADDVGAEISKILTTCRDLVVGFRALKVSETSISELVEAINKIDQPRPLPEVGSNNSQLENPAC